MFKPKSLLSGKEDASGNFARGFYNVSKPLIKDTLEQIRHLVESSDNLQVRWILLMLIFLKTLIQDII